MRPTAPTLRRTSVLMPWPVAALAFLTLLGPASAGTPVHQRIDQLIAAGTPNFDKLASPSASDSGSR